MSGDPLGMLSTSCSVVSYKPHPLDPGEDDCEDVVEEVLDVAARWKFLGVALRIRPACLDTISSKNHTDPNGSLRDILHAWLRQTNDTMTYGQPSWRMVCQAIHKRVGGNNPALARRIATKHSKANVFFVSNSFPMTNQMDN